MTEADKDAIKDMVNNCAGWQVVESWWKNERNSAMTLLVFADDEQLRGKIQFIDMIFNEVSLLKDK